MRLSFLSFTEIVKLSTREMIWWGWGGSIFLLERGDKPEKVPFLLLLYSSITFTLYVGKVKFPLLLQDSHPSLYSTKTLYHLYISDPFW